MRGFTLVAIRIHTTRCHLVLHTGLSKAVRNLANTFKFYADTAKDACIIYAVSLIVQRPHPVRMCCGFL